MLVVILPRLSESLSNYSVVVTETGTDRLRDRLGKKTYPHT